ncbi:GNAT family N-acetyltransferase [Xanthovirga aplysinae]|uniref:GNAT family N-acetyltransferase n=1 Tax=Xanthovirga aplysinae TaxID=2529853 RepID=UPI0012BC5D21|nr:GNAT family N-acetyltransferase [Xanthovirga aplysinae]MTI31148.1 GNAT family N-acetyltransferase [Xanthovirga aplysinae]
MTRITDDISLLQINISDHQKLYDLMKKIYPPVYQHLWPDKGEWYLKEIYSEENLRKELNNPNSRYYFVLYDKDIVGILRVLLRENFPETKKNHSTKLQRIYLDSSVHGKGIGRKLITWVEKIFCTQKNSLLWLEAMDSQDKAIRFYEKLGFKINGNFRYPSEMMHENLRGMYRMSKEIR